MPVPPRRQKESGLGKILLQAVICGPHEKALRETIKCMGLWLSCSTVWAPPHLLHSVSQTGREASLSREGPLCGLPPETLILLHPQTIAPKPPGIPGSTPEFPVMRKKEGALGRLSPTLSQGVSSEAWPVAWHSQLFAPLARIQASAFPCLPSYPTQVGCRKEGAQATRRDREGWMWEYVTQGKLSRFKKSLSTQNRP